MRSYIEVLKELYSVNLFSGMKLGLENMRALQVALDYPDRNYPCIHIAGTNGKGTLAQQLSLALKKAGYRVGVFTSPHIASFRERIRINGKLISEKAVVEGLEQLFQLGTPATFFEYCTALALSHFAKEAVDVAVIETGLGGRLDATNVIHPVLSIITSIGYDHMEYLGDTLEEIAEEKAGIVKPGVPVLIGNSVPYDTVAARATAAIQQNSELFKPAIELLRNDFLQLNTLTENDLEEIGNCRPPCRYEWVNDCVVLDVAHNPAALDRLFRNITQPCRAIVALSEGKDLKGCLEIISRNCSYVHFVEAPNGRSVPAAKLQSMMPEKSRAYASISQAMDDALAHQETLVCCGSFFIMADIRQYLGIEEARDPWDTNEAIAKHSEPVSAP